MFSKKSQTPSLCSQAPFHRAGRGSRPGDTRGIFVLREKNDQHWPQLPQRNPVTQSASGHPSNNGRGYGQSLDVGTEKEMGGNKSPTAPLLPLLNYLITKVMILCITSKYYKKTEISEAQNITELSFTFWSLHQTLKTQSFKGRNFWLQLQIAITMLEDPVIIWSDKTHDCLL